MNRTGIRLLLGGLVAALPLMARAQVVINEILYHAPAELDDLQYVELHNAGSQPVDIGNWAFTKGIQYRFPAGARIEPRGYVVVCADADRFQEHYAVAAAGVFQSKLGRKGERIELTDASGKRVDSVKFDDKAPWPTGPDGHSGSLERICPTAGSDDPANWIGSPLSETRERPTGTPGKANAGFAAELPPVVASVKFAPEMPKPGQSISVEADLRPGTEAKSVDLLYRLAGPGYEKPEVRVAMTATTAGHFTGTIPAQEAGQVIRFRVQATGAKGGVRNHPAATEPRPAFSAYVAGPIEAAQVPFAWVIHTTDKEVKAAQTRASAPMFGGLMFGGPRGGRGGRGGPGGPGRPGPFGGPASEPGSFQTAFVYFDPATQKTEFFDFVQVTGRKGGQKVHLYRDRPLDAMTTFALIFEGEQAAMIEPLSFEVYRRSGMPTEKSHHVRLWLNGKPTGYTVLVEQPNRAFLRRNGIGDAGNLYKLLWYGGDLVGQHEKHSNRRGTHDDLIDVVEGLQKPADAQWEFIEKNFDVDEVATYFAVNAVLSHWDGFFNNYFTYHDIGGTGKWMMFPWDQDSTWGLRLGGPGGGDDEVFYNMALTFGMNGDEPPSDGGGWWRPPGFFSGPLLANPKFRKVFLGRTKYILESVYTEAAFGPVMDDLEKRLVPEVRVKAQIQKQNPDRAVANFRSELGRARKHLRLRREFLLSQAELKNAQAMAPTRR